MTKDFKKIAKETLDKIFSMVENDFKEFDADFEDENLVVETNGLTFVISIHNPYEPNLAFLSQNRRSSFFSE